MKDDYKVNIYNEHTRDIKPGLCFREATIPVERINPVGAASAAINPQPGEKESRLKAAPTEKGHMRILYTTNLFNCKMWVKPGLCIKEGTNAVGAALAAITPQPGIIVSRLKPWRRA